MGNIWPTLLFYPACSLHPVRVCEGAGMWQWKCGWGHAHVCRQAGVHAGYVCMRRFLQPLTMLKIYDVALTLKTPALDNKLVTVGTE